jgi:hypothetical protein
MMFMVAMNNQQRQGLWRLLVADCISMKCLQALSGYFFYQILSLQAVKDILFVK